MTRDEIIDVLWAVAEHEITVDFAMTKVDAYSSALLKQCNVSGSLPPDCYIRKKIGCHCVDKCGYEESLGGND